MDSSKVFTLKKRSGEIVCNRMVVASDLLTRMKGLMFSSNLPDCDGFLIKPCNSIHTFFMNYNLDLVFLNNNFEVVKVIYNLSPWRVTLPYFRSSSVLEMKAGTLIKNIKEGELLEAICIN